LNALNFFIDDIHHLRVIPVAIIKSGVSFMYRGMNVTVDEIGLIHDMDLPEIVAIEAKIIIGLIIFCSSVNIICGIELEFDHMVTILKRME
jgi:hypothetical protein